MKIVAISCDLCKQPIKTPADHFEFKLDSVTIDAGKFVVQNGVQSPAKKRVVKVFDFHNTCNNEVTTEWNNMISSLEKEAMRQ